MRLLLLAFKNLMRNKVRTALTVLGVAVAVLAFTTLRTVLTSWNAAVEYSAKDRIATRHKVTFVMSLPKKYIDDIRNTPGVTASSWANWFGGKDPLHETEFFATLAVDVPSMFEVFDELVVTPDQKAAFIANKSGALIGDVLAKKMGWKVGQKVTLRGSIFPGDWEFEISGIYKTSRRSLDRSTFFFHWEYMNDALPERRRDKIGWVVSRIDDAKHSAAISRSIDAKFDDRDIQTVTMSERSMNLSFMGMFSAVLTAMDWVSLIILGIMMLIMGNTIAMGVRERTNEYGVMRAIGFFPRHIGIFVLGEGLGIGILGGLVGLGLAFPLIEKGMGRWLEENMGGFFPYFRIAGSDAILAVTLAVLLGVLAAAIPAYRASKLNVTEALRRVG